MAVKYWENLLKDVALNINEESIRDDYMVFEVHTCFFDKNWTREGIKNGITKTNNALIKKGQPPIQITENRLTRAVNIFHKEIKKVNGKTVQPIGPDRFGNFQYPKRVGASTKGNNPPGVIYEASETKIVADNGRTITRIIGLARQEVGKYLVKHLGKDAKGFISKSGLNFAHGEAPNGAKTTLGAMEIGKRALNQANSDQGEQDLLAVFNARGTSTENIGNIKKWTVGALRDYIKDDLRINIGINEGETGDVVKFKDEFTVEAAFKIQDKNFAKYYDEPGIRKEYLSKIKKALNYRWGKGDITGAEYNSSPKGKVRMKNATVRQMERSFEKFLKNNPQFTVLAHTKPLIQKKQRTKNISAIGNGKGKTKTNRGTAPKKLTPAVSNTKQDALNPISIKNLINAMLPTELLNQMGSPRLNNRTGRFRTSAQVTNVVVGPRGGLNIDYTYQLNPYQTFEPGGAQGSTDRDPRALIGLSIREIAQEMLGSRFIKTRRV